MRLALSILVVTGAAGCSPQPTAVDSAALPDPLMASADIQELPPFPFWARGPGCCLDGWGAISFYVTNPADIPPDFNLLDFFDPRALGAEWAVSGFGVFESPAVPKVTNLKGLGAVPAWFFRPEAIAAMLADGTVTVPEMESHNPVKGHATVFHELFFPVVANSTQARHVLKAQGTLDDGGTFKVSWINQLNENTGALTLVGNIDVRPN